MRLENQTDTILQVMAHLSEGIFSTSLESYSSACYGDLIQGEKLQITSPKGGIAIISMDKDEIMWDENSQKDDEFVKSCVHTNNFLQLQDVTHKDDYIGRILHMNEGICIRITAKQ